MIVRVKRARDGEKERGVEMIMRGFGEAEREVLSVILSICPSLSAHENRKGI